MSSILASTNLINQHIGEFTHFILTLVFPFFIIWLLMIFFRNRLWMQRIAPSIFDWVDFVSSSISLSGLAWWFYTLLIGGLGVPYTYYFFGWFSVIIAAAICRVIFNDLWVQRVVAFVLDWINFVVSLIPFSVYLWGLDTLLVYLLSVPYNYYVFACCFGFGFWMFSK